MSSKPADPKLMTSCAVTFTAADLEATIALYKRANRAARMAVLPAEGMAVESSSAEPPSIPHSRDLKAD